MFVTSVKDEKTTNYPIMEGFGFYRPTGKTRKIIRESFAKVGITIYGNGWDLVDEKN